MSPGSQMTFIPLQGLTSHYRSKMSFKPQPIHIFVVQYGLYASKGWQGGFSLYIPRELDTPFPRGPCLHI